MTRVVVRVLGVAVAVARPLGTDASDNFTPHGNNPNPNPNPNPNGDTVTLT